jgi:dephospho-CoA kinase
MIRVGLTGGIGSGKSAVSELLAQRGAIIIDLDQIARDVVAPGEPAHQQIVERFGPELLLEDGTLDRPAMAAKVFGDDVARGDLQKIIFVQMGISGKAKLEQGIAEFGDQAIFVTDAPILFETNTGSHYIGVIVVEAPLETRLARLKEGRGVDEDDARRRMAVQWSDEKRREAARWIVPNDGDRDALAAHVDALWAELRALNAAVIELGLEPAAPIPLDQPLPVATA